MDNENRKINDDKIIHEDVNVLYIKKSNDDFLKLDEDSKVKNTYQPILSNSYFQRSAKFIMFIIAMILILIIKAYITVNI